MYAPEITLQQIVQTGPLAINQLSQSAQTIHGIRLAYSKAIQHIFLFALAVVCISIPASSRMQWLNVKKVSEVREARRGVEIPHQEDRTESKTE
jgi:hypothetical protein